MNLGMIQFVKILETLERKTSNTPEGRSQDSFVSCRTVGTWQHGESSINIC